MHEKHLFLTRKGDGGFKPALTLSRKGDKGFNPTQARASKGDTAFTRNICNTRAQLQARP